MNDPTSVRFLDDEAAALERLAREHAVALGAAVRTAVRLMLGLPVPSWARALYPPKESNVIEIVLSQVQFELGKSPASHDDYMMVFTDVESGIKVGCVFSADAIRMLRDQLGALELSRIQAVTAPEFVSRFGERARNGS